jgi:hypothetical protein
LLGVAILVLRILEAKAKLEAEETNINAMLGSLEGAEYVGPRAPKLPLSCAQWMRKDLPSRH